MKVAHPDGAGPPARYTAFPAIDEARSHTQPSAASPAGPKEHEMDPSNEPVDVAATPPVMSLRPSRLRQRPALAVGLAAPRGGTLTAPVVAPEAPSILAVEVPGLDGSSPGPGGGQRGRCLTVSGYGTDNGTRLVVLACANGAAGQRFIR
jgi:hypothetical protein